MKKAFLSMLIATSFLAACDKEGNKPVGYEEIVAVANRGDGSVSFIDANTNALKATVAIPGSQPMYIVYVQANDKLYVGDRTGKKVHILNPNTRVVEQSINVGDGVFHMWADGQGKQLWVNNDIDNTISVIDLKSNTVIQTINVDMKPHDVFLTSDGAKAYVSVLNTKPEMPDKIYMYSTTSFIKTAEANVGKDPHLFHLPGSNKLFVPCQSGQVYMLNGTDLNVISNVSLTGAHGLFPSPDQRTLFVSNITGGQLYAINTENNSQKGSTVSSLLATPHNIVVNETGTKMFVTHSGASANMLSTYSINNTGIAIAGDAVITTSTNPFGLAYYKRKIK